MVDGNAHHNEESTAPKDDAVDFSDLQAYWSRVWDAQKEQISKAKSLAVQELTLSGKALLLSAVCVLLLVGISLIIWTTLLLTLGYGAHAFGVHWLIVALSLIVINVLMFWVIHRIFKNAIRSIGLSTTIKTLFEPRSENSSAQNYPLRREK
ncbi:MULTISPECIES: hypothetical protein [Aliiglaciecola]|uniref:hypothetical protein n=1 Tax=Aliiglaciecola TaxID=1406885 RepID=UPI001C08081B|nr:MULTISPECIES: hypothetical protein [Aliiglaciecola]MBU2876522.1 hypothetical protein [Aliiglaciecola lipolytica]MDO6711543.1 hypothetical protein [Aliiglaciecola sp. 2_MG-2023]MDO6752481.1 hypothetical protein [Aliiglaciecola sp. 1_MG-2023]